MKLITLKYIYWHGGSGSNEKGEVYTTVHLLSGYNNATLSGFKKMVTELRKTFPQAKDSEITCGKVFKSSYVDSHSIIAWSGYLPKGKYRGWIQHENARCEYRW